MEVCPGAPRPSHCGELGVKWEAALRETRRQQILHDYIIRSVSIQPRNSATSCRGKGSGQVFQPSEFSWQPGKTERRQEKRDGE